MRLRPIQLDVVLSNMKLYGLRVDTIDVNDLRGSWL